MNNKEKQPKWYTLFRGFAEVWFVLAAIVTVLSYLGINPIIKFNSSPPESQPASQEVVKTEQ